MFIIGSEGWPGTPSRSFETASEALCGFYDLRDAGVTSLVIADCGGQTLTQVQLTTLVSRL